jgi:hypothetical protein
MMVKSSGCCDRNGVSPGAPRDLEALKRYRDAGVDRVVLMLPPKPRDAILPMLDESAPLVTAL